MKIKINDLLGFHKGPLFFCQYWEDMNLVFNHLKLIKLPTEI